MRVALTLERNGEVWGEVSSVLSQLVSSYSLFFLFLTLVVGFSTFVAELVLVCALPFKIAVAGLEFLLSLDVGFRKCTVVIIVFVRRASDEGACNLISFLWRTSFVVKTIQINRIVALYGRTNEIHA